MTQQRPKSESHDPSGSEHLPLQSNSAFENLDQHDFFESSITTQVDYRVFISKDIFSLENNCLKQHFHPHSRPVAVFIDQGVHHKHPNLKMKIRSFFQEYYPDILLYTHIIPGGEVCKNNPEILRTFYQTIEDDGLCKRSTIFAIGGGAFLDLTGYGAATSHRGINYWRVPTTTLSQCDSGVGVKSGVNFDSKKNAIGIHSVPQGIIIDPIFLDSLPKSSWISGFGECLKIALLKSKNSFEQLESSIKSILDQDISKTFPLLKKCAKSHFDHISKGSDPFEKLESRPLDFGHWSAHRMEILSQFSIEHGEAVMLGIALDCLYSEKLGMLSSKDLERILKWIKSILPTKNLELYSQWKPLEILKGIEEFRKHIGGPLCITLIDEIGSSFEVQFIDLQLMEKCIRTLPSVLDNL